MLRSNEDNLRNSHFKVQRNWPKGQVSEPSPFSSPPPFFDFGRSMEARGGCGWVCLSHFSFHFQSNSSPCSMDQEAGGWCGPQCLLKGSHHTVQNMSRSRPQHQWRPFTLWASRSGPSATTPLSLLLILAPYLPLLHLE